MTCQHTRILQIIFLALELKLSYFHLSLCEVKYQGSQLHLTPVLQLGTCDNVRDKSTKICRISRCDFIKTNIVTRQYMNSFNCVSRVDSFVFFLVSQNTKLYKRELRSLREIRNKVFRVVSRNWKNVSFRSFAYFHWNFVLALRVLYLSFEFRTFYSIWVSFIWVVYLFQIS